MSTTVAAIVAEAFDEVALEIAGVIKAGTLTRPGNSTYDAATATYSSSTSNVSCRVLDGSDSPNTLFPGYVHAPGEVVLWIEAASCKAGDTLTVTGWPTRTIQKVVDVVGSGAFFGAVAV